MDHCLYCDKPIFSRRVCSAHYQRARRGKRLDLLGATAPGRPLGRRDYRSAWYARAVAAYRNGATTEAIARTYGKSIKTVQAVLRKATR